MVSHHCGAGIYILAGRVASVAGMLTPLAFLVATVIAGFSAFTFAELTARLPTSASEAVYAQARFGRPRWSRFVGLLMVPGRAEVSVLFLSSGLTNSS